MLDKSAGQIVEGPLYRDHLVKAAEEVVKVAQALAPKRSGDYARGIKVVIRGQKVYASATDWKSHWVEWGSINQTPSAPLRRGVRAVGLQLRESERR